MAFEDVVIPEGEAGGNYFKFVVGTELKGVFVSKAMGPEGEYQGRKIAPKMEYTFRIRNAAGVIEQVVINPPVKLSQGFELAEKHPGGFKAGHRVIIKCTSELPPPPEKPDHSPMKVFKLQIDRVAPVAGAAAPAPKPPPPPPAAAAGEFDDIPY